VVKIARGMLDWLDLNTPTQSGWTINHGLEILHYLLNPARDVRGPILVDSAEVWRACPPIPR
jgi:hypothetical protein